MAEDKRQNEIIRIQKKRNNFVMLDKGFLEDENLSYKAKGILAYLLSKPDNWKVIVKDLINHSKDGKKAIYSGLNELKQYGYYKKIPVRDEMGRRISHWESVIYELPQETESNNENSLLLQKGEVDESAVNSTSSLLPPFVYIDNVNIQNEDIQNGERNKNYNNNIYNSDIEPHIISNQSVLSEEKEKTDIIRCDTTSNQSVEIKQEQKNKESSKNATSASDKHIEPSKTIAYSLSELEEIIKDNISYKILPNKYKINRDMLDEIVFIMTSTIMTEFSDGYITMGEEKVPQELVKSVFFKLTAEHIAMFVDDYNKQVNTISKTTPYIRKSLYKTYGGLSHRYSNMAYVDMPQLARPKKRPSELE